MAFIHGSVPIGSNGDNNVFQSFEFSHVKCMWKVQAISGRVI